MAGVLRNFYNLQFAICNFQCSVSMSKLANADIELKTENSKIDNCCKIPLDSLVEGV